MAELVRDAETSRQRIDDAVRNHDHRALAVVDELRRRTVQRSFDDLGAELLVERLDPDVSRVADTKSMQQPIRASLRVPFPFAAHASS